MVHALAEDEPRLLVGHVYVPGARSSSAKPADGDEARQAQQNGEAGAEAGAGPTGGPNEATAVAVDGTAAGFHRLVVRLVEGAVQDARDGYAATRTVDDSVAQQSRRDASRVTGTLESAVLQLLGVERAGAVPGQMIELSPGDLEGRPGRRH